MKWTKERPAKDGFYWVLFKSQDIHNQGPMVYYFEMDEGELFIIEAGGDYMRSIGQFETEDNGEIALFSDEHIALPEK